MSVPVFEGEQDRGDALRAACFQGDGEKVRALLAAGADVNARTRGGGTPLMLAVAQGHIAVVRLLLGAGADIHARTRQGDTALLYASRNLELLRLLVEHGANISDRNSEGGTVLRNAVYCGNNETVAYLLDHKGEGDIATPGDGTAALWLAAGQGYAHTVRLLLDHGADIHARAERGRTALMMAAEWGQAEAVRVLLEHGANANDVSDYGWTALMEAVSDVEPPPEYREVVSLLLQAGADIGIQDRQGRTALRMAEENELEAAAALLRSA